MFADPSSDGADQLLQQLALAEQQRSAAVEERHVVMFADIVGYSSIASQWGDTVALELVRCFENATRGEVLNSSGRVVMTAGDAIMVCWPVQALGKALRAAMSILDHLENAKPYQPRAEQIRVRVGIHYGTVMRLENGDLIGHTVNLACRLQTAALPGEILLSAEAAQMAMRSEDAPKCCHVGLMRVKGLEAPVRTYRVRREPHDCFWKILSEVWSRAVKPMRWPVGSWVLFVLGSLLALGAGVAETFPRPFTTAAALWVCFGGSAMVWSSYQPRTISRWHAVARVGLLLAWALVVIPLGRFLINAW